MKIKEVCQKTGLSDKAVRTYIRSGLVFPKYNENYTGRRNFDFSEDDVKRLVQIAILRKYDFSIREIKALFDGEVSAKELLDNRINDLKNDVDGNINVINSMVNVAKDGFDGVDDMCNKLNNPHIAGKPVPVADSNSPYKLLYMKEKKNKNYYRYVAAFLIPMIMLANFMVPSLIAHVDKGCVIAENYESLVYEGKTYLKFDSFDYEAENGSILVRYCKVENQSFISNRIFQDSLITVKNVPNNEMVFLQTDYDYDYPNGKSEFYYVEQSVYNDYLSRLESFTPEHYAFKICNKNYDYEFISFDDELLSALMGVDKSGERAEVKGYLQAGYGSGIPVCAYDKTKSFYKYIGEIMTFGKDYFYFDYSDVGLTPNETKNVSGYAYLIDSKYHNVLDEINSRQNGVEIKFAKDE